MKETPNEVPLDLWDEDDRAPIKRRMDRRGR
jgi:hypothetical protein